MQLACKGCGHQVDFPDCDIRVLPIERGDDQLFQILDTKTSEAKYYVFRCEKCGSIRASIIGEPKTDWQKKPFISTKVFDDPTPNGQINLRLLKTPMDFVGYTDLSEDESYHLLRILLLCGKKLVAVFKHLQSYGKIEDELIEETKKNAASSGERVIFREHAQDLLIEFDEFLVQLKSSLDYLVKVPTPIVGKGRWVLNRFGENGEQVFRALEKNLPKGKKRLSNGIIQSVKKHQPWLKEVIKARDRLNHLIGEPIDPGQFMVYDYIEEGSSIFRVHRPMWSSEQTVRDFMNVIWNNLVHLFEDFVITTLFLRFKPGLALFHGIVPPGSAESPWRVTTTEEMERVTRESGWTRVSSL